MKLEIKPMVSFLFVKRKQKRAPALAHVHRRVTSSFHVRCLDLFDVGAW